MLLVHCCPYCSSTLTSPRIDQIAQTLADFVIYIIDLFKLKIKLLSLSV